MVVEYKRKSVIWLTTGSLLDLIFHFLLAKLAPEPDWLAYSLGLGILLSVSILLVGFCYYVKAKGHDTLMGLIGLPLCLGMFKSIILPISLVALILLPDKTKN